jgi:hypothetical protein
MLFFNNEKLADVFPADASMEKVQGNVSVHFAIERGLKVHAVSSVQE